MFTPFSYSPPPPPPPLHRQVNVSLPEQTRANGTLFAVVYVHKASVSPLEDSREVHYAAQLTTHISPTHTEGPRDPHKVKCNSASSCKVLSYVSCHVKSHVRIRSFFWPHQRSSPKAENPVSHWRPHLSVTMMSEDFTFNKAGLPSDVRRYMRV